MGIEQIILVRASGLCGSVASAASAACERVTRVTTSVTTLAITGALALTTLSGCGQKGPLTLPNDPEFKQRATLPEIVRRQLPGNPAPANATTNATAAPAPRTTPPASAAPSPASR